VDKISGARSWQLAST